MLKLKHVIFHHSEDDAACPVHTLITRRVRTLDSDFCKFDLQDNSLMNSLFLSKIIYCPIESFCNGKFYG